ncbi:MAG: hypothetical protein IJG23_02300 [Clostridia bacterium]|nr:hypothetical protein [Clostridia bacterium]
MFQYCCGFGHRELYENIDDLVKREILFAISLGCSIFYTGGMGAFDSAFSRAVRECKKEYPHIRLFLVVPYITKQMQRNKEYYEKNYDEILKPAVLDNVHPKYAITKRNHWMVQKSNLIIGYTRVSFGGAYDTLQYAKRQGKPLIEIPALSHIREIFRLIPEDSILNHETLLFMETLLSQNEKHILKTYYRQRENAIVQKESKDMFDNPHFRSMLIQAINELDEEKEVFSSECQKYISDKYNGD